MAPATQHKINALFLAATYALTAKSIAVDYKAALGLDDLESRDFDHYVQVFNRGYRQDVHEYAKRRNIFDRNMGFIHAHNSNEQRLWTAGANHLTDRTDEELAQLRGWKRTSKNQNPKQMSLVGADLQTLRKLPESIDWTTLKMASEIPDQSSCGSCWAVATAAMLHGSYEAQRNGSSRTFSVQQLVSCTPNELECGGAGGCDGATVELAMEYVMRKGLVEERDFPYTGFDGRCPAEHTVTSSKHTRNQLSSHAFLEAKTVYNVARQQIGLQSWETLPENKARPVYEALLRGPVAVSVAAGNWFVYSHGVFNGCSRDSVIDHAVVLFGYGKQSGKGYWTVRNSWGRNWGENGYIKLLRHDNIKDDEEYCGVDEDPKAGTACKPYPDQVTVCGMCGIFYDTVAVTFGPK